MLQNTPDPNPHVLAGAMAGSVLLPGDSFNDNRTDFQITEARPWPLPEKRPNNLNTRSAGLALVCMPHGMNSARCLSSFCNLEASVIFAA